MNTDLAHKSAPCPLDRLPVLPKRRRARKRFFSDEVEEDIARLYFEKEVCADAIAEQYRTLAPKQKLSASGIRLMARRGWARIQARRPIA